MKTKELNVDKVHSHELSAKQLERLALSEWRSRLRKSYTPGTKYPETTYKPKISIESKVDNLELTFVKLAERITGILETMLIRIGKLENQLNEKIEELDSKIDFHRGIE